MSLLFSSCSADFDLSSWYETGVQDKDINLLLGPFQGGQDQYSLKKTQAVPGDLSIYKGESSIFEKEEYIEKIASAVKEINAGNFRKIVLSRRKFIELESREIHELKTQPAKTITNKFSYKLYNKKDNSFWMGASPELILSKKNNQYLSHSLAGTATLAELFGEKERIEQKYVTDYILDALELDESNAGPTKAVKHGKIWHLHSQIAWTSNENLQSQLQRIHPTPAVCGIPTKNAMSYICTHESSPRNLYTGIIGIESPALSKIYVNLRCAQLFKNGILLYAGGGITENSDPEAEFEETEMKMEAILADLL